MDTEKFKKLGIAIRYDAKKGPAPGRPYPLLAFCYCKSGYIRLARIAKKHA
jgi:hypothetical protein